MGAMRSLLGVLLFCILIQPIAAEEYTVILRGKVTMADGSAPPFTVGLERKCSDVYGDKPGPLTNKKGEYIWTMNVDPMRTRACHIQATHAGYISTSVEISALHGYLDRNINLPPIVITSQASDPYAIIIADSDTPPRAKSKSRAAMKALDAGKNDEARQLFSAAVEAAPKFARGWHALGVLYEYSGMQKEAREAYQHAIEADARVLPPYVTLTRLCIKAKDWDCAAQTADALIKADKKNVYPQVYLHNAVALYELKQLDRAEASARECIRIDPNHMLPRVEYVLGRILEAKGDTEGAREHMSKYLELDKRAPDPESIRTHLKNLGNAASAGTLEPELEHLVN
jgi:tetratricopeptide (TPR) repeat protein